MGTKNIQTEIRNRREALGMTRLDLATQVEVSVNYIYKIENGLKVPTLKTLHKIALALKMKPSTLLDLPLAELKDNMLKTLTALKKEKKALSR